MNNILKVMHRDFRIVQKQYLLMLISFMIVFTLLEIYLSKDFTTMKLLWFSFIYFLTMQSQYTNLKFDNVSLSLPINRSDNVIALYLSFFFLFSFAGLAIGGLNNILYNLNLIQVDRLVTFDMALSNFSSNIFVLSVMFPLYFKFGDFRKAILYSLIFFIPSLVISGMIDKGYFAFLNSFNPSSILTISSLTILYFFSMLSAIMFYDKREF